MKINFKTFAQLFTISLATFFASCSEKNYTDPQDVPPAFNGTANTTIAALKAGYSGLDSIGEEKIIWGIVIGNDESGNIYKKLMIQDSTGGIELNLDRTEMYTEFRVGQKVFVKCQGMYIGDYNGLIQLGSVYANAIGRMSNALINYHLFRDGLPGTAPAAKVVTIPTLNASQISTLVKLENVHFSEVGSVWATQDATATNRTLVDEAGNTLVIRTSQYANFAGLPMPYGSGTVTGVLSIFGTTYQLTVRDTADLKGFLPPPTTYLNEPFAVSQGAFTAQSVSGAQAWTFSTAGYGMTMSGFASSASHANEDWLISPALDLKKASSAVISFDHTINKGTVGNMKTYHTLWISKNYTSGAPSTATWEQVPITTYPAGNNWTFVNSGNIAIPAAYQGIDNVHFAFKYICTDSESASWEIKNVKVVDF